jgi:hypothetical protein
MWERWSEEETLMEQREWKQFACCCCRVRASGCARCGWVLQTEAVKSDAQRGEAWRRAECLPEGRSKTATRTMPEGDMRGASGW